MNEYNLPGFLLVASLALVVTGALASHRRQPFPAQLVMLAVLARILGSTARYEVLFRIYGRGDAIGYYEEGLYFAQRLWRFDLGVLSYSEWFGGTGRWWGTRFIENLSGLVVSCIGPSMRGEFLVFSLVSFLGLYCIAIAFLRVHPGAAPTSYARLTWLWPSLLFWPSAVGKESVSMLAIGLVTLGYVGQRGRVNWPIVAAGLMLAFAIRPHVAGMLILAAVFAHWLGSWGKVELRRILEGLVMVGIAAVLIYNMQAAFGLDTSVESWEDFYDFSAGQTLQGGANLGQVPSGPLAPLQAVVNIWMRPFVWEVHNFTALVSALEILLLWFFVWRRRRNVGVAFKDWRHDRLLRFAVPLVIGYTVATGLTFGNLGIIARQRALAFPFVFLPLCAVSVAAGNRARRMQLARRRSAATEPRARRAGPDTAPRRGTAPRWRKGSSSSLRRAPGNLRGEGPAP